MRTRPQFGSSASASAKKSVLNRLNNRNPKYRITGRDHCPRNGQNNESIHRWMNRGFSFRWIAGIVKKKEEKEKKRRANSGEIARVNSGTERGGDGRGAGRGGGRTESGRVGSSRAGPSFNGTKRAARTTMASRERIGQSRGRIPTCTSRTPPLRPVPDGGKIFRGFYNPPPCTFRPMRKIKNKKYSRGDNAVRFPDVYKKWNKFFARLIYI